MLLYVCMYVFAIRGSFMSNKADDEHSEGDQECAEGEHRYGDRRYDRGHQRLGLSRAPTSRGDAS